MTDLPDILVRILQHKRTEVDEARQKVPPTELVRRSSERPPARDLAAALRREPGGPIRVLAEIKRRSPSAGAISEAVDPLEVARQYVAGGADAISVLTDREFFGGRLDDLEAVAEAVDVPVLRKDFVVDPYQVPEARSWGADGFLLIADALDEAMLEKLVDLGRTMGMEALVEAHTAAALERAVGSGARLIGINNRDLHTFTVDLATTERLAPKVPDDCVLVAESGVGGSDDVRRLAEAGAHAVLVGESLMRADDPAAAVRRLKESL